MSERIVDAYEAVRSRIDAAARDDGRRGDEVFLLPVSKTFPAEDIAVLYRYGVRAFGENRAAELAEKAAALPPDIRWHFIGRLQANKVRKVVEYAGVIHSIDTAELLDRVDRIAGELGKKPEILLEVSVSGEECKGGVPLDELDALAERAAAKKNVSFTGLMTMAPLAADEKTCAALFEMLLLRRSELETRLHHPLPLLSMGMSGDFETAVRHGSTPVRVGTAIFGAR